MIVTLASRGNGTRSSNSQYISATESLLFDDRLDMKDRVRCEGGLSIRFIVKKTTKRAGLVVSCLSSALRFGSLGFTSSDPMC